MRVCAISMYSLFSPVRNINTVYIERRIEIMKYFSVLADLVVAGLIIEGIRLYGKRQYEKGYYDGKWYEKTLNN